MRYVRQGNCSQCGICCIAENCEFFDFKENIGICKIYNHPDRPSRCVNFPAAPPVMIKECSFYFIDTWDNNRIIFPREI